MTEPAQYSRHRGLPVGGGMLLAQQGLELLSFGRQEANAVFD